MSQKAVFAIVCLTLCSVLVIGQSHPKVPQELPLDSLCCLSEIDIQKLDSLEYVGQALERAIERKDALLQINLLEELFDWSEERIEYQIVINNYLPILPLYKGLDRLSKYGDRMCLMSNLYLNIDKTDSSQLFLFEAIQTYKDIGDTKGEGLAMLAMTNLTQQLEEYDKSNNYALQAIELLTKEKDYVRIALCYLAMARNYVQLENADKAIDYATQALSLCEKHKFQKYDIISGLIYADRGEAYMMKKEYDKAQADFEKEGEINELSSSYNIGIIYSAKEEYKLAIPYFEKYLQTYEATFEDVSLLYVIEKLLICHEKLGQKAIAYDYLVRLRAAEEQNFETRTETLKSELIAKYEADKKDAALSNQKQLIEKKTSHNKILTGLFVLLTLSFAGLLYLYRKSKSIMAQLKLKSIQNETLLKEIHHRVKNNLQTISSLLYLQSATLIDSDAKEAIAQGQHRVESMALIHKHLYQGDNLAGVEMKDYITRLSRNLQDAYLESKQAVSVNLDMQETELDVDTAIPLGLIINELLTNVYKYAFTGHAKGQIDITFKKLANNQFKLRIQDNGIGKASSSTGFGTQLVQLLSKQLEAVFKEGNDNGYWCEVESNKNLI